VIFFQFGSHCEILFSNTEKPCEYMITSLTVSKIQVSFRIFLSLSLSHLLSPMSYTFDVYVNDLTLYVCMCAHFYVYARLWSWASVWLYERVAFMLLWIC